MVGTRSGKEVNTNPSSKSSSSIQKNTTSRKTPEGLDAHAKRKRIEEIKKSRGKRQQELEKIRKDLQNTENELKNPEASKHSSNELQQKKDRFEKYRQDIEADIAGENEDLMDLDQAESTIEGSSSQPSTENTSTQVQSQSKPEYKEVTYDNSRVKEESVEGSIAPLPDSYTTNPPPNNTPDIPMESAEQAIPQDGDYAKQDDEHDQILENFKTLSMHGHTDGVADAWFRERKATKLIVRYGPKKAAKYVVQQGKPDSTAGLQQVSDDESRLSSVMVRDGMGIKSRRYGLEHIVGIVGVAIVERARNAQSSKAPTTYVKIKWTGISEQDRHLCEDGNNWSTRSDLISMVGQELAESKIRSAWEKQEAKYNDWEKRQGRDTADRSPTPFPLDTFQKTQKPRRQRSTPLKERANETGKRDGTPPVPMDSTTDPEPNTVDGQAQNGVTQSESGQDGKVVNSQVQNNQAQKNEAQKNEAQKNEAQKNDDQPTPMSEFYKKWLRRNNIDDTTELSTLDDEKFARFEVAAKLYARESKNNKLSFVDDLNIL